MQASRTKSAARWLLKKLRDEKRPRSQARGPVWRGPLPRNHQRPRKAGGRATRGEQVAAGYGHDLVSVTLEDYAVVACAVPGCAHREEVRL